MYNNDLPTRAELPSSKQLLRSTLIAIIVATVLLVTIVLPSEYGIDPTRIGRLLGLTSMGEIKMALAAEAQKDKAADATLPSIPKTDEVTVTLKPRTDAISVTLKPGEGTEVKLDMPKGAKVSYEWSSAGGPVNHDTHGDAPGVSHKYSKGLQVGRDAGQLTAVFDGRHGWFWRNRGTNDVTITLKTSGMYRSLKRVA
ncbi:MAG: transmembrane anchor protein [Pyrinomonadaceae bacterium]|nr:transmembrane anchor protein [Pyrinomonadaceae bacterium]